METHPDISTAPASLDDACGSDPSYFCERVFDLTNGDVSQTKLLDWLINRPLTIVIIVLVAWIGSRLARRYLRKAVRRLVAPDRDAAARRLNRIGVDRPEALLGESTDPRREARAASISVVVCSTVTVLIWTVAVILIVGELGFELGPFIAGAGIAGVALGFGAQSLVRDCIAGLFMLIEDQYGIGDIVDLGEATGEVEEVTLRTTIVRGLDGTLWHVPNGAVIRVGNMSQLWSVALVDVDVAYDADLEHTRQLMLDTTNEICRSETWQGDVIDEPVVLGVEALGADGITMRMIVKTTPGSQWAMQRTLREALKVAFDDAGIEIPFPQRTVWMRSE